MIGSRLGPYEITAKLGEGGMGEVYRATDSKLRREVAIKVLPAAFIADPERLARFEREAQLLAQLHHPNVASIFGVEESAGMRALVMELVDGPTLAERLQQGPVPLEEGLPIAIQIAWALEAAHEKGIVHRDLKPQNIKAAPDGTVKVLDFGLAKAMEATAGSASAADLARSPTIMNSPTLTAAGTRLGVILGTAAYMAPEQARGGAVDKRADIWAFGVVLYEMLAGRSLFAGPTVSDTLAGVLKTEIDWTALPADTPAAIRRLLRRCLERNPKSRLHDIADARIVIEEVRSGPRDEPAPSTAPMAHAGRPWWLAAACLAAGLALGVAAARLWSTRANAGRSAPALTQLEINLPENAGLIRGLALSPDGRKIAFAARGASGGVALWVRALDTVEARQLPETSGARYPFWAPDSRRLGFFSARGLMWIDSTGGSPIEVTPTSTVENVRGAAWGADDWILFAPTFTGPLQAVSAKGGAASPATRIAQGSDIGTHRFPAFLPDGRRFVYYAAAGTGTEPGSLYLGRIGALDAKLLGPANSAAVWAEPGHLLYARGDSIVAQGFDDRREELVGAPRPLGISMGSSLNVAGLRSIAASRGGLLVYRNDRRGTSEIAFVDRSGKTLDTVAEDQPTWHYAPRLSPDNRLLAVSHLDTRSGFGEIWLHDLARRLATPLTRGGGDNYLPTWLRPAGRELVFGSARPEDPGALYRIAIDQEGEGELLLHGELYQAPSAFTPDGRRLVFERTDAQGATSLWIRDLDGTHEARIDGSAASEFAADLSPDGRWVAYVSDATRAWEVYVRRLDGTGGAIRISNEGGIQPLWRRDGRELFYVDPRGRLVAVPIAAGDPLQPAAPLPLFDAHLEEALDRQYDAFDGGQRFVLNRAQVSDTTPIVAVLDWTALLDRRSE